MKPRRFGRLVGPLLACMLSTVPGVATSSGSAGRPSLPVERTGPVDWILLVDTSGSMSGLDGHPNVFPRVKGTLRWFVEEEVRDRDSLALFTFSRDSRLALRATSVAGDRQREIQAIDGLEARGDRTHTGAALKDALAEARRLESTGGQEPRVTAILLLTDGKEDVRGISDYVPIPHAVSLLPDRVVPYVVYVSLGTGPDPQVADLLETINDRAALSGGGRRATLVEDPQAHGLEERLREIRTRLLWPLAVEPRGGFDLARLRPGSRSGPYRLDVFAPVATRVELSTVNLPPDHVLEAESLQLDVSPEQGASFRFHLRVDARARDGLHRYALRVRPVRPKAGLLAREIELPVQVRVGWTRWERWIDRLARHWLFLLLGLLLLAVLLHFSLEWIRWGRRPSETALWLWAGSFSRGRRPRANEEASLVTIEPPHWSRALDGPLRLGAAGVETGGNSYDGRFRDATATVLIVPSGLSHELLVEAGTLAMTSPGSKRRRELSSGDRCALSDRCEIALPRAGGGSYRLRYESPSDSSLPAEITGLWLLVLCGGW